MITTRWKGPFDAINPVSDTGDFLFCKFGNVIGHFVARDYQVNELDDRNMVLHRVPKLMLGVSGYTALT